MHSSKAVIQLNVISDNLSRTRKLLPHKKILSMVKANAYGHGIVAAARALENSDAFGVATLPEALQLIHANVKKPIVVMRGFSNQEELLAFTQYPNLVACVHAPFQIALIENEKLPKDALSIWFKIDTGMHRLGVAPEDFLALYARLNKLDAIKKPFVLCSHLADADNSDKTFTQKQIAHFGELMKGLPNEKSLLNSAGILTYPESSYDWIRPGIILYGISPFSDSRADHLFKPAMTLMTQVLAVKPVRRGEKIGYQCKFTAPRDMQVAIVGLGYGDGYPRHAENGTPVLIHNVRCPIVGRVSMDMTAVDVTHLQNVRVGDDVILWGESLPIAEIAARAETIPYEIFCQLTARVAVEYV